MARSRRMEQREFATELSRLSASVPKGTCGSEVTNGLK